MIFRLQHSQPNRYLAGCMTRPGNNKLIRWLFHHYLGWLLRRTFQEIKLGEVAIDPDKSVLLLANHYSAWDGFLMYHLNNQLFHKKFHVLILEKTIRRFPFMKHLGAFSITKSSKDMLGSLAYAAELLNDPQNLVLIFPQGALHSNFSDRIAFEKGLAKIISQTNGNFQYLLAANFTENFEHKKPTAFVYLKAMSYAGESLETLNQAYQQHYDSAKLIQTKIVI